MQINNNEKNEKNEQQKMQDKINIENNTAPYNLFKNDYADNNLNFGNNNGDINDKLNVYDEAHLKKNINVKLSKLMKWKLEVNDYLINNVSIHGGKFTEIIINDDGEDKNNEINDENNKNINFEENETNDFYIKDGIFILKKNIKTINNYGMYYYKNLNNITIDETNIHEKYLQKIKERNSQELNSHHEKYAELNNITIDETNIHEKYLQKIKERNSHHEKYTKFDDFINIYKLNTNHSSTPSGLFLQLINMIKEKRKKEIEKEII